MKENLDIDVFFDSLIHGGVKPLFTCDCGTFGCGGYYVEVIHSDEAYIIRNSYKPYDNVNLDAVIEEFEYSFSWQDILSIAKQICFDLRTAKRNDTESIICSGAYGIDISHKVKNYEEIIKQKDYRG